MKKAALLLALLPGLASAQQPNTVKLSIQVENRVELADVYSRLERADGPVLEQGAVSCCYARSEKAWISDPQGVKWETFLTTGDSTTYGCDIATSPQSTCCAPKAA